MSTHIVMNHDSAVTTANDNTSGQDLSKNDKEEESNLINVKNEFSSKS